MLSVALAVTSSMNSSLPVSLSPPHVTFRARLGGSSETDSGSLISLLAMESWVSGGATIIVSGVLMTVDAECSVAISSLSEGECIPDTAMPASSADNTAGVIGGVVVAVLFIIAAMVVAGVVIVALFLKRRQVKQPNSGAKE